MAQLNMEILKTPLGFIKVLELLFAILAFATVSGYGVSTAYSVGTAGCATVKINFGYPFALNAGDNVIPADSCASSGKGKPATDMLFGEGYKATSEFFVFTGVISFLFVLAMSGIYLLLWTKYESDNRYPIIDLICTSILAVFWLFAAVSWAFAAGGIKGMTNPQQITDMLTKLDKACATTTCTPVPSWGYGSLAIGALCGFVCLLLFSANVWFVFKETVWFRNRTPSPPPQGAGPRIPDGPPIV